MPRRLSALLATLLAVSVLVPLGTAAPASAGETTSTTCKTSEYTTKIRRVKGRQAIGLTLLEAKTYPGKTTIKSGQKITVRRNTNLKAAVRIGTEATFGASAMLKKVINVYGQVTGRTGFRSSISTTKNETTTVTSSVKMVIPGGKSVAWFRGYRKVGGTFQYSWCHHFMGMPQGYGVVTWEDARFWSYGYRSSGGQRCDLVAQEAVAKAAKNKVCL